MKYFATFATIALFTTATEASIGTPTLVNLNDFKLQPTPDQ